MKIIKIRPLFTISVHFTYLVIQFRNVCVSHRSVFVYVSQTEVFAARMDLTKYYDGCYMQQALKFLIGSLLDVNINKN
jgi:hypothetical protein